MNTPRWPDLTAALDALAPAGLAVRTLRADDVPHLIACLHAWYPALAVAAVGYMLDPDFYAAQVALEGDSFDERPYVMVVVESAGEFVSCVLLAAEEHGRIVSGTMTVVSPSAYGKGLGGVSARVTVGVAAAIGADLAYALAALDNHASRKALEAAGMSLCAVVPGCERSLTSQGEVVWVAEALYVRQLAPGVPVAAPCARLITPAVATMVEALTGAAPADRAMPAARVDVRPTGIDAGCSVVSLRDLDAQYEAEASGLVLLGLVPGGDRFVHEGRPTLGFAALYGRPAAAFEGHRWPALESLPPRLAQLTSLVREAGVTPLVAAA